MQHFDRLNVTMSTTYSSRKKQSALPTELTLEYGSVPLASNTLLLLHVSLPQQLTGRMEVSIGFDLRHSLEKIIFTIVAVRMTSSMVSTPDVLDAILASADRSVSER